jgi:hypothetical protein
VAQSRREINYRVPEQERKIGIGECLDFKALQAAPVVFPILDITFFLLLG